MKTWNPWVCQKCLGTWVRFNPIKSNNHPNALGEPKYKWGCQFRNGQWSQVNFSLHGFYANSKKLLWSAMHSDTLRCFQWQRARSFLFQMGFWFQNCAGTVPRITWWHFLSFGSRVWLQMVSWWEREILVVKKAPRNYETLFSHFIWGRILRSCQCRTNCHVKTLFFKTNKCFRHVHETF